MYSTLFSGIAVGGLKLKNRLIMAPIYLGYAGEGGTVSPMILDHYRLMAQSTVAMVVVENCTVDFELGSGSTRTLRADTDDNLDGLKRLAEIIKAEGALACLQINHAGRFAFAASEPVAPSAVATFDRTPAALTSAQMDRIADQFAAAAVRTQKTGFDMVELHGGTGYLLAQFLSPWTNKRDDGYGGTLENRQKFPLEVFKRVKSAVGGFPIGYRFMADEWLPDGLKLEESIPYAKALDAAGIAYISVMGGTYESFFLPEVVEKSKNPGYMMDLSAAVKKAVNVPVVSAGRFSTGEVAENALEKGYADIIGLARVLWADPEWPKKVATGCENEIVHCDPNCGDACIHMVMKKKPAFCLQWPTHKLKQWKTKFR